MPGGITRVLAYLIGILLKFIILYLLYAIFLIFYVKYRYPASIGQKKAAVPARATAAGLHLKKNTVTCL